MAGKNKMIFDPIRFSWWSHGKMFLINSIIVILLVIALCGTMYRTRISKAKPNRNKLKKIAKSAHIDNNLCKENKKSILKIKKQIEEFTQRVASHLMYRKVSKIYTILSSVELSQPNISIITYFCTCKSSKPIRVVKSVKTHTVGD